MGPKSVTVSYYRTCKFILKYNMDDKQALFITLVKNCK